MVGEEAELHKKLKGNIAELATATELAKLGLAVFRELGDNSRVDLITIVEGHCIKIQVKWAKVEPEGVSFCTPSKPAPTTTGINTRLRTLTFLPCTLKIQAKFCL